MSGSYPPPGYPPPQQPGWGDQWQGRQQPPPQQLPPQQPPPQYDFPTVRYGGLTAPQGSWGEPPRRKRNTGRLILAVVSILVIIGGVVTAVLVLTQRHTQQNATPPSPAAHTTAPAAPTTVVATTTQADPGVPNGSTTLSLPKGACVTAQAIANNQYQIGHQVTCGTAQSDLVLAVVSPAMTGCPDHQFLRVSGPSSGVYCFTLDVKKGDCLDNSFLKAPCTPGAFAVLSVEPGPGSANSCTTSVGATHWVPIGHDPVSVACVGPAKTS